MNATVLPTAPCRGRPGNFTGCVRRIIRNDGWPWRRTGWHPKIWPRKSRRGAWRKFLNAHYEVVTVDVGRFDKNLAVPARYGITQRLEGVPALLVVDPRSNRLLNAGHVSALADARSMTPQALADWLALWVR